MSTNLNPNARVAVLGAAALDWVARVKDMPTLDGIVYADDYTYMPGGTGGNIAEAVTRLGRKARFLGDSTGQPTVARPSWARTARSNSMTAWSLPGEGSCGSPPKAAASMALSLAQA